MFVVDVGRWADTLMERYAGHDVIGSALFVIRRGDDPAALDRVRMKPLGGHPADHLRWYRPPPSCVALGLVSAGWVAPIDSPVRPSAHPDAQRVVQSFVIARSDEMAARIRYPDGSIIECGKDGYGRVVDVLRAALRRTASAA